MEAFSESRKKNIFFTVVFLLFYIFTVAALPHMGVKMRFLTFGGRLTAAEVRPDFIFALVLCTALLCSKRAAVVLGILFGFLCDLTCRAPLFSPMCCALCGLYAYKLSGIMAGKGLLNAVLVSFPLLLTKALASTFFLLGTWHTAGILDILFGAVIPEFIYNVIIVIPVYFILKGLMRLFGIEQIL